MCLLCILLLLFIDSVTLRVLRVSYNDIGDDGMAVISEALQNSKSLTELNVRCCGLSVQGNVVCGFNERCTFYKMKIIMFSTLN